MTGEVISLESTPKKAGGSKLFLIVLLIAAICVICIFLLFIPQIFNTNSHLNPTVTPELTQTPIPPPTLTEVSRLETLAEISRYKEIDWRELRDYPQNHIGEYIKIQGKVFNIVDSTSFQMNVVDGGAVYIQTKNKLSKLYADMTIWVYGIGANTYCGNNAFGAQICSPTIKEAFWSIDPL